MKTKKSWKKGQTVKDGSVVVTVTGEKCWQCRKVSVGVYQSKLGRCERCLNGCGPRGLRSMFRY